MVFQRGTLVITSESPGWRRARPELMGSFTGRGGALIKLTECVGDAARADRRLNVLRRVEVPDRAPLRGPVEGAQETRFSGCRGR